MHGMLFGLAALFCMMQQSGGGSLQAVVGELRLGPPSTPTFSHSVFANVWRSFARNSHHH